MKNTSSLSILQYNVRKERVGIIISLLADPRIQHYDIVAIQESWRNPQMTTTISSHWSGFHLLYRAENDTKVCFYINKKIDPDSWKVEFVSADMCTLKLKICNDGLEEMIHVHNVYNPSPASQSSTNSSSTLPTLSYALDAGMNVKHIVVGDFNLHHPYWSRPLRSSQHAAADQLLDIIKEVDFKLALPPDTITWEARQSCSTIDLVFLSARLIAKLEHCKTRLKMEQSSDHIPILTKLLLQCETRTVQPR